MKIKAFITNLGKYNEGELAGKWITFPVTDEEMENILQEIGIDDHYEEWFFTDWETPDGIEFGEFEDIEEVNEVAEKVEEWDEETFLAACQLHGVKQVIDNDPDDYFLNTSIHDDYDIGYYYADETGMLDGIPDNIKNYFDYESFGRDIRLESDSDFTEYGYIEYRR